MGHRTTCVQPVLRSVVLPLPNTQKIVDVSTVPVVWNVDIPPGGWFIVMYRRNDNFVWSQVQFAIDVLVTYEDSSSTPVPIVPEIGPLRVVIPADMTCGVKSLTFANPAGITAAVRLLVWTGNKLPPSNPGDGQ